MQKTIFLWAISLGLSVGFCSSVQAQNREVETEISLEFNERQLEKHLTTYKEQLNLSRRQERKIKAVQKRYTKKEEKLAQEKGLKLGQKRALQKEKAEALLFILDEEQIEKLNSLAGRKGLFKRII
ncbi:hypothetical protein [Arundinibacter roseus]|uniref:DUF4890 domain-containing protein n=1 Tax=Arundinibacter roseus TaxID=2070510 RepID=A0A4R4KBI7_9BACT|nr:hypothetical protein [Arundinibacter roseus]TDB65160.1 hypothetical protein EZE20_10645 [Arundinibacter roseus]